MTVAAPGVPGAALVVSTACPTCAAPLDFREGCNAVRCEHCRSNLLVTGRGQVLSYAIRARLTGGEAVSLARFAGTLPAPAGRAVRAWQCWVPYHRLRATELRWQRRIEDGEQGSLVRAREAADLGSGSAAWLGTVARWIGEGTSSCEPAPGEAVVARAVGRRLAGAGAAARPRGTSRRAPVEFAGRRIERNLSACPAASFAAASLGVRPDALALELFRRDALDPEALIVPPTLSVERALEVALDPVRDPDLELVGREVVGRLLSVVYFPFWAVDLDGGGSGGLVMIDAVSGSIVARALDPAALAGLAPPAPPVVRTVGFRALVCPNCGWDLAVEPEAVVFHCAACDRAWLLEGEEMRPVPFAVAAAPPELDDGDLEHLPVWQVGATIVPAFRRHNLKLLKDLALRLSRRGAPAARRERASPALHGCALDGDDASRVAAFLAAGVDRSGRPLLPGADGAPAQASSEAGAGAGGAPPRLLWLPFARGAYGLRDPLTGMELPPELAA